MSSAPIFVVGAPRSGTSLLRMMLNRHPRIGLCDETYFFYWVVQRARTFGDLADPARRTYAIERYLETRRVRRLNLDLGALRRHLVGEATSYPRFLLALLEFYAAAGGKQRAGEKTPQHALEAARLLEWYPEARVIHIVRDPRDVAASMQRMPWASGSRFADAALWCACVDGADRCAGDPRYLAFRYEDLIAEPTESLSRVMQFVGEEFAPSMLQPRDGQTDRWWFERAQGQLDTTRIERWRTELPAADIALVEAIAAERMSKYGYVPSEPPLSGAVLQRARLASAVANLRRRTRQLPQLYWRWIRPDQLASEERLIDSHASPGD